VSPRLFTDNGKQIAANADVRQFGRGYATQFNCFNLLIKCLSLRTYGLPEREIRRDFGSSALKLVNDRALRNLFGLLSSGYNVARRI
jgi:hypothetical protein